MHRIILIFLVSIASVSLLAQSDSTANAQGEVASGEVIIEKDKQITLPKADKMMQRAQLKSFASDPLNLKLASFEPSLEWPPYKSAVPFERVSREYPTSEYPNYVKLGYGNYGSPLAEVGIFERLGSFDLSNKLFFESYANGPVNGSNSGNAAGLVDLAGTYKSEKVAFTPFLTFSKSTYRFYGNTDRTNPIVSPEELQKVRWSDFKLGVKVSGEASNISYSVSPEFGTTSQKPADRDALNQETLFGLDGVFDYRIDEKISTGFAIESHVGNYDGGISYNRSLFQANPWLRYKSKSYQLNAGFAIASGESGEVSSTGFYPDLRGDLFFHQEWTLSAYVNGGVDWQSLSSVLGENEFLDDSLLLLNTENKLTVGGALKGTLLKNLTVEIDLAFSSLGDLPFFVPASGDSSRYTLTYDSETVQRFQLKSKVSYAPTNTAIYGASFTFNSYAVEELDRPWHLPTFEFEAYASHNIQQKIILSANLLAMGGLRAPTTVDFGIENLDTIVDMSLNVDYLLNERASIFINTRNLFNQEYERYLGYPVRGVSFKIGGQYRF